MKRMLALLLALVTIFSCAMAEDYTNPQTIEGQYEPIDATADDYGIGDPFVMRWNGMYYLYASSKEDRVRVYTSRDLINWEYKGWCTEGSDVYFASAPEVTYWRGDFYMVTSPGGGGHYILKSDDPLGVFRPVTKNFGYVIDGAFWTQDNGDLYMLFPEDWLIKQVKLNPETMLPDNIKVSTGATLRHWTEGPGLIRRGDWHFLTFTGNHVCSPGYKVAYASRKGDAIGQYLQPVDSTLLVQSVLGEEFKGLGHSSNVVGPDLDSIYTPYHSLVSLAGPARLYNLDRLLTNGGVMYSTGPTNFPMPIPAMPEVYGDMDGEKNSFTETETGYTATAQQTNVFTQEVNFVLNGGTAQWIAGSRDGMDAVVAVNAETLTLTIGDAVHTAQLPEIGREGRLHTLRIECNAEILHAYVDSMRVLTLDNPGIIAENMTAVKAEGVSYAFIAHNGEALGSGDNAALKVIPGTFAAVHSIDAVALDTVTLQGKQEEKAAVLGEARYNVRVAETGEYCFDITVGAQDAGKRVTLYMDGEVVWTGTVPEAKVRGDVYAFSTDHVALPAGDHVLTITAENVTVSRIASHEWTEVRAIDLDFTKARDGEFYTLGNFMHKPSEGNLSIRSDRSGFAVFGDEGNTDYEMYVRFRIPVKGIGSSGIILRATDVSFYDSQVEDSYYGYSISLTKLGVNVRRIRYGASGTTDFEGVSEWANAEEGELIIRAEGRRITISVPGSEEPILSFEDDQPFTHGLYGFFSTGKELTVLECRVTPID